MTYRTGNKRNMEGGGQTQSFYDNVTKINPAKGEFLWRKNRIIMRSCDKSSLHRHVDEEAQLLLTDYRDNKARKKMNDNRATYRRYEIEWIGREGLAPETHEEYLNDFINHFYKNVLRLVDRAMKKEDTSEQGRIVSELMQVDRQV